MTIRNRYLPRFFLIVATSGLPLFPAPTPAAPSPQVKEEPRRDRYGDPLPPGAIARLGSLRFRIPGQIASLAFAPDGKTLAVSSHGRLFLVDAVSGKRIKRFPTPGRGWTPETLLAFSPDGKRLLSAGPKKIGDRYQAVVRIWERASERPPREYEDVELVAWLGWSAGGEPLAICVEKGALHLHELAAGRSRRFACAEPQKYETGALRLNPPFACAAAGRALALVDDKNAIHVWDTVTGRERCTVQPKDAYTRIVALSADGCTLAALNRDRAAQAREAVQLWDATTGKVLHTVATDQKYLSAIAFTPDGKTLAAAGWSDVRFWDVATGRERSRSQGEGAGTESHCLFRRRPDAGHCGAQLRGDPAVGRCHGQADVGPRRLPDVRLWVGVFAGRSACGDLSQPGRHHPRLGRDDRRSARSHPAISQVGARRGVFPRWPIPVFHLDG